LFAKGSKDWIEEFRINHPTRGIRWIVTSGEVTYEKDGKPVRLTGIDMDITSRKRTESDLRHSLERTRALIDNIEGYAILTTDLKGNINIWNRDAEKIFGYEEREVAGQPMSILFTPRDRERGAPEQDVRKAILEGRSDNEREYIRKNGEVFFGAGMLAALKDGEVLGFVKVVRDLTKQREMEESFRRSQEELDIRVKERTHQLEVSNERKKEMLRRVVGTQELERHRISRDLHDHLGQQLTALRLILDSLNAQGSVGPELKKEIERVQAIVGQIDKDLDFLTSELRPAALKETGLVAALQNFVQEWSRHFAIAAEFHTAGLDKKRLSQETETNLYRIAQEALNNVFKHAEASRVDVMLERRNKDAVLIIEDNGKGFILEEAMASESPGLGLISMRERAALVGGTLEIESTPGEGTTIFVRVHAQFAGEKALR
jgi:PAS domain S-box-containing protein